MPGIVVCLPFGAQAHNFMQKYAALGGKSELKYELTQNMLHVTKVS